MHRCRPVQMNRIVVNWPEVTKRCSDTHKRTKTERGPDRRRAPEAFQLLRSCGRVFAIKRSTLIDSLARIGWSAGAELQGSMSDAPTATDRDPDRRAVRSSHGSA